MFKFLLELFIGVEPSTTPIRETNYHLSDEKLNKVGIPSIDKDGNFVMIGGQSSRDS